MRWPLEPKHARTLPKLHAALMIDGPNAVNSNNNASRAQAVPPCSTCERDGFVQHGGEAVLSRAAEQHRAVIN